MLKWVLAAAMVVGYGLASQMDYEEAVAQEERYRHMVCEGYWPDYNQRQPECD